MHRSDLTGLANEAFSLEPFELDGNDVFTTSLFVRFQISEGLKWLRQTLERHPAFRSGRAFDPHMSLHYGPPPKEGAKSQHVSALLGRPVRFDRLALIEMRVPIEDHAAIQAWRTIEIISLDEA